MSRVSTAAPAWLEAAARDGKSPPYPEPPADALLLALATAFAFPFPPATAEALLIADADEPPYPPAVAVDLASAMALESPPFAMELADAEESALAPALPRDPP